MKSCITLHAATLTWTPSLIATQATLTTIAALANATEILLHE
jgi:hypothetical protein